MQLSANRQHLKKILTEFLKFSIVGLSGVAVGLAILNLLMFLWGNFPIGNIAGFFGAVTWNFVLNRKFTFQKVPNKSFYRQWLEFVIACLGGAAANWVVSMGLYYSIQFFHQHYNLAAIIGVAVGSIFNFLASRFYVFQKRRLFITTRLNTLRRFLRLIQLLISAWTNYRIKPKPWAVSIELTHRCNCRCSYCHYWRQNTATEMNIEQLRKVFIELKNAGVCLISFTGGEPLIRTDLFEIAKEAKKLGFIINLNTNAMQINEAKAQQITELFDLIVVSLDSGSPKEHDSRRGVQGAWNRTVQSLSILQKYQRQKGQLNVLAVLGPDNINGIELLLDQMEKQKIPVFLQPQHRNLISGNDNNSINTQILPEQQQLLERIINRSKKGSFLRKMYMKSYLKGFEEYMQGHPKQFTCLAGAYAMQIDPFGNLYPCQALRKPLGNVLKDNISDLLTKNKDLLRWIKSPARDCYCWLLCTTLHYVHFSAFLPWCKPKNIVG